MSKSQPIRQPALVCRANGVVANRTPALNQQTASAVGSLDESDNRHVARTVIG